MNPKGLLWAIAVSGLLWAGIFLLLGLGGCIHYLGPTTPVRYESDPEHYPYYRAVDPARAGTGFYPHTNPGVIVGGPRNGSVVYNGKVYHDDGTMDFLRR